jgi:hypothetical protein
MQWSVRAACTCGWTGVGQAREARAGRTPRDESGQGGAWLAGAALPSERRHHGRGTVRPQVEALEPRANRVGPGGPVARRRDTAGCCSLSCACCTSFESSRRLKSEYFELLRQRKRVKLHPNLVLWPPIRSAPPWRACLHTNQAAQLTVCPNSGPVCRCVAFRDLNLLHLAQVGAVSLAQETSNE